MGIKAIQNRIKAMRGTLDSIEKAAESGNMRFARDLADGIERESDALWKSLWKVEKESRDKPTESVSDDRD